MGRPNLFEFATSELSQDAMLCWLASWAAPDVVASDPDLPALGRAFLEMLFAKAERSLPEPITSLKVDRQSKRIDITIVVNRTHAICIEDKAGTREHSNQLRRYADLAQSDGIPKDNIVLIYVQTYEQSDYTSVKNDGYHVVERQDLLGLLRPFAARAACNAIVQDFHDRLQYIEDCVQAYHARPLACSWCDLTWMGFYSELREHLDTGAWGYVANQRGGFQGFWWHSREVDGVELYLQLEQNALCFKIAVESGAVPADACHLWRGRVLDAARALNVEVKPPQRMGRGQTVTIAQMVNYRVPDSTGCLDMEATLVRLRAAQKVLDRATGCRDA